MGEARARGPSQALNVTPASTDLSHRDALARELRPASTLLESAARQVRLLGAATPLNLVEERRRLATALACDAPARPRWRYASCDLAALRGDLARLVRLLDGRSEALARLTCERAEELELECALSAAVGTRAFAPLARRRFVPEPEADPGLVFARRAIGTAAAARPVGPSLATDDPSPGSLASRMRAELGARRLPFSVRVVRGLSALAATGERHVLVAAGRRTSGADVERTVLHEIGGHVVPRVRARSAPLALFRFGSARGTDDQEGYALTLEERGGFLDAARARELAARRLVVDHALRGASYEDAARALLHDHGFGAEDAARIAERTYRGGQGEGLGLARDRAYLEAWLRVREALSTTPALEDVLSLGQVSLDAARTLQPLVAPA